MTSWKKGESARFVPLSQASGRVLDIYCDIQQLLGVGNIGSFFQLLGAHPRFLAHFWGAVRPIVRSQAFASCARRLRADAYTRVHTYFQIPNLRSEVLRQQFIPGASEELMECIDFFSYSDPISLLLASFLSESFEGPAGNSDIALTAAPAPKPHPCAELVEEARASAAVKSIYADIHSSTETEVDDSIYQAFARWPGFLESYWNPIKAIAVSDLFLYCRSSMCEDARFMVSELPGPVEFNSMDLAELGMNQSEAGTLIRGTNTSALNLAASLLNVSVARIAVEGGILRPKSFKVVTAPEFPATKAS